MSLLNCLSPEIKNALRTRMHKVAALMTAKDGIPIARDEITIKEAAYILGVRYWKHRMEKRALFDGLMSLRQLGR